MKSWLKAPVISPRWVLAGAVAFILAYVGFLTWKLCRRGEFALTEDELAQAVFVLLMPTVLIIIVVDRLRRRRKSS